MDQQRNNLGNVEGRLCEAEFMDVYDRLHPETRKYLQHAPLNFSANHFIESYREVAGVLIERKINFNPDHLALAIIHSEVVYGALDAYGPTHPQAGKPSLLQLLDQVTKGEITLEPRTDRTGMRRERDRAARHAERHRRFHRLQIRVDRR